MTTSSLKAKTVRVRIEEGKTGLFFATSPDLKGLLVAEPTIDALYVAVPKAIVDLYDACGEKVVVSISGDHHGHYVPWVAFPADAARRALEECDAA
jgi:hypothetical protein